MKNVTVRVDKFGFVPFGFPKKVPQPAERGIRLTLSKAREIISQKSVVLFSCYFRNIW
jgi:hypothetical protein